MLGCYQLRAQAKSDILVNNRQHEARNWLKSAVEIGSLHCKPTFTLVKITKTFICDSSSEFIRDPNTTFHDPIWGYDPQFEKSCFTRRKHCSTIFVSRTPTGQICPQPGTESKIFAWFTPQNVMTLSFGAVKKMLVDSTRDLKHFCPRFEKRSVSWFFVTTWSCAFAISSSSGVRSKFSWGIHSVA